MIEATGLPLGLFDEAEYDEFTFKARPGDLFVLFSDGILDARNRAGELFGRTRLEKIVSEIMDAPTETVVDAIFNAVTAHSSGVETFDDQTVVALRVKGSGSKRK